MTKKAETLEVTVERVFEGDVQAQSEVRVSRSSGAVRAILKKIIMDKLGLEGDFLSAATVELSPGKSVLLMGAADVVGHLQVNRSGLGAFEVVAEDSEDLRVDAVTEAFLALKTAQFERGQLNLSGPWSAEDWEARSAESFEEAERLLKG